MLRWIDPLRDRWDIEVWSPASRDYEYDDPGYPVSLLTDVVLPVLPCLPMPPGPARRQKMKLLRSQWGPRAGRRREEAVRAHLPRGGGNRQSRVPVHTRR